jgi:hypothetical protein
VAAQKVDLTVDASKAGAKIDRNIFAARAIGPSAQQTNQMGMGTHEPLHLD